MNQCTAVMAGSVSSQGFLIPDSMDNMAANPGAPPLHHQPQVNNQNHQAVWRRRHRQQGERSGDGEGRDGPEMDGVPAATIGTAVPAAIGGAAAPVGMGGAAAPAAMGGAVAMGGTEAMGGRVMTQKTGNDFETWKSDVLHAGTEAAKATWLYICCYEQCSLHINC